MSKPRTEMSAKQEAHLKRVDARFRKLLDVKYRKGAAEHGDNLLGMSILELLDEAIDENVDQAVFLLSLRERILGVV